MDGPTIRVRSERHFHHAISRWPVVKVHGEGEKPTLTRLELTEPPPIPINAANLTPWTKSNFLL